jgi:hypothetical protein
LRDPHPSSATNGPSTEGIKRNSNHQRQSDDGQAVAGNQSVEKIQDWNEKVVGDVSDHVEKPGVSDVLTPVCMSRGLDGEAFDRLVS